MRNSQYPQLNDRDWLLARYAETQSATPIASEVGCTREAVLRALRRFGVQPIRSTIRRPARLDDRDWLGEQVRVKTLEEIARELGCTRPTVRAAVKRYGISLPRRDGVPVPQLADPAWLRREIQTKTVRLIAEELGCSQVAVYGSLKRHGIPVPRRKKYRMTVDKSPAIKEALKNRYPNGRSGSAAANWRGGRSTTGTYVWLHRELVEKQWPDHPSLKRKNWTTKQEHILVKEAVEGRCLRKGEIVHHENDDKHDNHPDNLKIKKKGPHTREHFTEPRILRAYIAYLSSLLDERKIEYEDLPTFRKPKRLKAFLKQLRKGEAR